MTAIPLRFNIPGDPVAKGRARFARGHAYTPAKTRSYEGRVAAIAHSEMHGAPLIEGAVSLDILAVFAVPRSWPGWKRELALGAQLHHTIKPDRDNIEKAIKDGLTGVVWKDDSQVCDGRTKKIYGRAAAVWITVNSVDGPHSGMKTKAEMEAA